MILQWQRCFTQYERASSFAFLIFFTESLSYYPVISFHKGMTMVFSNATKKMQFCFLSQLFLVLLSPLLLQGSSTLVLWSSPPQISSATQAAIWSWRCPSGFYKWVWTKCYAWVWGRRSKFIINCITKCNLNFMI